MSENDSDRTSGTYRIILGQEGEFDLYDIDRAMPLIVAADPDDYEDDNLSSTLEDLAPGNKIEATLVDSGDTRETELFDSQLWRFEDVELLDRTRAYHGFGDIPIVSAAETLVNRLLREGKGIGRADIRSGDDFLGRVVAFNREHPSPAEPVFEDEMDALRDHGEPPFAIFQTATEDARFFVHYYLVTDDCRLAEAFKSRLDE